MTTDAERQQSTLPREQLQRYQREPLDWGALIQTALTAPGSVGNVYNRLYTYSFLNQMFLRMQGVQEPVATYKRWQSLGRQVVRGAKAKEIVRPIIIEKKDAAGEVEGRIQRFKPVRCIFGLSDTEGDELPPYTPPGWDLTTAHEDLEIDEVPFEELNGNVQGYSFDRSYAINPVAVYPTKTRFHEMGHIVLGHTASPGSNGFHDRGRRIREFQAESTALLVSNELEMFDEGASAVSRGYIQHWLRSNTPPDSAIRQVFTATDTILRAGRAVMESAE